jgi:hypothetical protein
MQEAHGIIYVDPCSSPIRTNYNYSKRRRTYHYQKACIIPRQHLSNGRAKLTIQDIFMSGQSPVLSLAIQIIQFPNYPSATKRDG